MPLYISTGASAGARFAAIPMVYVALAVWIKIVVARAPRGIARLAVAAPVLAANTLAFAFFSPAEILPRTSLLFILSWLANFKVLAFCLGREPLRENMSVAQIAAVVLLPVFPKPEERTDGGPKGRLQDSAGSGAGLLARWLGKLALLGAVVYVIMVYGDTLPTVVLHYVYGFGLYAFVGFLQDGPAALAVEALGLQLVPTFDQPWLSSSLADFWGRRWNIPTSSTLRCLVYDTIVEGALIKRPPPAPPSFSTPSQQQQQTPAGAGGSSPTKPAGGASPRARPPPHASRRRPGMLRKQLGLHAVFLTSGLVHEWIAWNVSERPWGWKWTLFFYVQAPLMTAEHLARRALHRAGVRLPTWLTTIATLALLEALAYDLFFGFAAKDTTMAARVVAACEESYALALQPLQPLLAAAAPYVADLAEAARPYAAELSAAAAPLVAKVGGAVGNLTAAAAPLVAAAGGAVGNLAAAAAPLMAAAKAYAANLTAAVGA